MCFGSFGFFEFGHPLVAHLPCEMDTQQILQVQETTLGQCLQVFAEPFTELS